MNPLKELDDDLGRLIFRLLLEHGLGPSAGSRIRAVYLDGANRLWCAAEAADSLARAIERENRLGIRDPRVGATSRKRLAHAEGECRGWMYRDLKGRPPEADGTTWPHQVAVWVAEMESGRGMPHEKGINFLRPDLLRSLDGSAQPAMNPRVLRDYASDLRLIMTEIEQRFVHPGLKNSRRGRPMANALLRLATYGRLTKTENPEIARRIVKGFGLSADGTEPPPSPKRATSVEAKEFAAWNSKQVTLWEKKLRDAWAYHQKQARKNAP